MVIKKVLSVKRFKAGYEIREEVVDSSDMGAPDLTMKSAYNIHGDYIGDPRTAHFLCVKKGIMPIKSKKTHCVCSMGYSHKDGKWHGWSHRAISGFKVGSRVGEDSVIVQRHAGKRGFPVGHVCESMVEAKQMAKVFAGEVS